jgi:hypothetical protein
LKEIRHLHFRSGRNIVNENFAFIGIEPKLVGRKRIHPGHPPQENMGCREALVEAGYSRVEVESPGKVKS